jgi:competence protein ComEC
MLLSSLSILMGAILVPSHYLWLYSTHIILVCLYLIRTKRLIVLFLTLLSFISVVFNEFLTVPPISLSAGQVVLADFEAKTLFIERSISSAAERRPEDRWVQVVYFSEDGARHTLDDFTLAFSHAHTSYVSDASLQEKQNQSLYQGVIGSVLIPNKDGSWWERNLYIKRQMAQLTIHFSNKDLRNLAQMNFSFRDRLLARLDQAFKSYEYWRFSKALLFGQNDLWTERDTWMIRTLGLAHLFVVSGLHTGFMFVIGRMVSRVVWQVMPSNILLSGVTRWHCDAVIVIPLLFAYAYLTDWGAPVVRASIMLSVYLCARMLVLKISSYSIITFALWLVLLFDPRAILSPGLWLSFSMVYLLIGFCQTSTKLSRLIMVQVMLSTASMVLILGWQEAISSVSILTNILLIPLAAMVWFPWGMFSCAEVLLIGSTYGYALLEKLLYCIMFCIEWVVFELPLLFFTSFSSAVPRWVMLLLLVSWVYQSPLRRGMVSVLSIWCILFSSTLFQEVGGDLTIFNKNNKLILMNRDGILLTEDWVGENMNRLMFSSYLHRGQSGYFLSPSTVSQLTPRALLEHDMKWVILKRKALEHTLVTLNALQVDWLVVSAGESLAFYFQNGSVLLRHSSCLYAFFLLKSDTCKRVEKLESVLNYKQI